MGLQQIIYTSHALNLMSGNELVELLALSRRNNTAAGITGLLLHADGSFMQTIEGAFDAVHRLFARIERDPRHGGVTLICDEPIEARSYDDWSMAFREISSSEAARLPGFMGRGRESGSHAERDLARSLMGSFAGRAELDMLR